MVDLPAGTISLVASGYTFLDGVLLEAGGAGDESALITETPKFRILRLHLAGPRAGEDEVLWQALPGMPDGLDRDRDGRVWVGLVRVPGSNRIYLPTLAPGSRGYVTMPYPDDLGSP